MAGIDRPDLLIKYCADAACTTSTACTARRRVHGLPRAARRRTVRTTDSTVNAWFDTFCLRVEPL